jgi:hypothetical protein
MMLKTKKADTSNIGVIDDGLRSQLKLSAVRLVRQARGQKAALDKTNAEIEQIEIAFGDRIDRLMAAWGFQP